MLNFLQTNYFLMVYGITWLLSVYHFKKYFDTPLRFFPIVIAYTLLTELLGTLVTFFDDFQLIYDAKEAFHTSIIYNFYYFIYFPYFFLVYKNSFNTKLYKKIANLFLILFIISNLINVLVQNPKLYSLVYAYLTGSIFLIALTSLHLWNLRKLKDHKYIKYNLLAWVSFGLLSFYSFYLPIKIIKEFHYEAYAPLRNLHIGIVILMYVFFSIGFVVSRQRAFK